MQLQVAGFSLQKAGYHPNENQDAFTYDATSGFVAIADGASDAFESRLWAGALVDAYMVEPAIPEMDAFVEWLARPIATWNAGIHWDQLRWYQEAKAERGAFATFLGLTVVTRGTADEPLEWHAVAVGDACLFHIRKDSLLEQFPDIPPDDFGLTPALVSNRADYNVSSLLELQHRDGQCLPGDLLVLVTDALAAALVAADRSGHAYWEMLRGMTEEGFVELIVHLRAESAIRNDDVTLVVAEISPGEMTKPAVKE